MRNNKEIRVDNKPVFYKKKLFEQDVIFVNDLLVELDTTNSFTIVSNEISKINDLIWAGLRLACGAAGPRIAYSVDINKV